jgi:hypothetical protein
MVPRDGGWVPDWLVLETSLKIPGIDAFRQNGMPAPALAFAFAFALAFALALALALSR